jgi:hypothetical protein
LAWTDRNEPSKPLSAADVERVQRLGLVDGAASMKLAIFFRRSTLMAAERFSMNALIRSSSAISLATASDAGLGGFGRHLARAHPGPALDLEPEDSASRRR